MLSNSTFTQQIGTKQPQRRFNNAVAHAGKKPGFYEEKHLRHFPRKSKHGLFL